MNTSAEDSPLILAIRSLEADIKLIKQSIELGRVAKVRKGPPAPNKWIQFTKRVGQLLKDAALTPTPQILMQFCSFLKRLNSYEDWSNEDIISHFNAWQQENSVTIVNEVAVNEVVSSKPIIAWVQQMAVKYELGVEDISEMPGSPSFGVEDISEMPGSPSFGVEDISEMPGSPSPSPSPTPSPAK